MAVCRQASPHYSLFARSDRARNGAESTRHGRETTRPRNGTAREALGYRPSAAILPDPFDPLAPVTLPARLALSGFVAFAVALVAAVALAIADLWLTGHSRPSILRETVVWPRFGVRLSPGGMLLLAAAALAGLGTWRGTR